MSPNKRRMITSDSSDEDDSFKHRRSSLRVNLSYSTNLTDSGNGSLEKMEAENNERGMDRSQINRRLLSNKRRSNSDKTLGITSNESKRVGNNSKIPLQIKEGMQLKRLTINLEDINAKVETLDTNCKRLKDAILNKTKEIFDKQDELSVKTAMVLANKEDCSTSISNLNADKLPNRHFENEESIICNQHTDNANDQQKQDEYPSINGTPKTSEKQRNSEKVINRSKVTPKRLFTDKGKKPECRIIEDIILDKRISLFPRKQLDQSDSPVLSGSNRRLQLLKSRATIFSQNQSGNHNNTHLTAYSDHSINIGQPITCSTFIEDNIRDEEENKTSCDETRKNQHSDVNISRRAHTINTLVSMEMTEIHGDIQSGEKHSSLLNEDPCNSVVNTEKKKCNNTNMEKNKNVMSTRRLKNIDNSFKKLSLETSSTHLDTINNPNTTGACVNTTVLRTQPASIEDIELIAEADDALQEQSNQVTKQNKKQCTLNRSDSDSIRSSLHVNTSLDAVTETSKEKDIRKPDNCGIIVTDRSLEITTNKRKSIDLDNQRESTNSNRTSLQMNTSMDSVCKTWRRKSNIHEHSPIENKNNKRSTMDCSNIDNQDSSIDKDTEANDIDSLENVSLIERLRNISTRNKIPHNDKLELLETENKERTGDVKSNDIISVKFQSSDCANNNSRDSHSYVEGTPYPISRSVLYKIQLKHKIQNSDNSIASCSNNSNLINNEENNSRTKSNDL